MIVGIDLGTTNSLIGVWRDGEARLIPNALGHLLTPSVVSIAEDGEMLVGLAARERLMTHPAQSASVFKRYMGAGKTFTLGTKDFRPEELSAFVLRSLKQDAERILGTPVADAVITVPAYFNDVQRKATQNAGVMAGLSVKRLLTEPTAAALAYGIGTGPEEQLILVADLGGGTFDVSLLHCFEGLMEVRATAGDVWLGGEDFVDVIVTAFLKDVGYEAGIPPVSQLAPIHGALRRQAELLKRRLSEREEANLTLAYEDKELTWTLDRARFEQLSEPVLARAREPIEQALRDARVEPETIAQVVLAGGASRMPMFRRLIGRLFRRMPLQHINPDEVVARGAAVRAGLLARDSTLDEVILTDVSPFTLGIEVSEQPAPGEPRITGLFLPIIERNTVVPASRSKIVLNTENGQSRMMIKIYQGESHFVRDNVFLGEVNVRFPAAPEGKAKVDVRFSYDASGLLEVDATVVSTGVRSTLVIEGAAGSLSAKEVKEHLARLAALKLAPAESVENKAAIARANRMYAQQLGEPRIRIGEALGNFLSVLETQDPARVKAALARLNRVLDRLDDEFFL